MQRERERERCVSDADASRYEPLRARTDPHHICPHRTHAKTTPLHPTRPSPLRPLQALEIDLEDQPKPDLFPCPQHEGTYTTNYKQKRTPNASKNQNKLKNGFTEQILAVAWPDRLEN